VHDLLLRVNLGYGAVEVEFDLILLIPGLGMQVEFIEVNFASQVTCQVHTGIR
jgi:hypothetical protein